MATSPIYSWPEPDNTDLVKNGALAIRTLGNAIDTTMGTMVAKTIIDAKGDLIAGTANDTAARLAVGNNGETLVADSSTSTGLRYQSGSNGNAIINGGFDIWQRNTSFSIASGTPQYTADRWTQYFNNTGTIAQETTLKPDTSTYSLKNTATGTSSDNAIFQLVEQQQMEQFRGKIVTLSVKLAGTVGINPSITLAYSTTANDTLLNTNTQITSGSTVNPTINASTFVTWALTFTIPTTAKQLRIGIGTGSVVNTNVLYVAEVQLELGSVSTTFKKSGGTIQGELAACQRYFIMWASGNNKAISQGFYLSSTFIDSIFGLPVEMRTTPTIVTTSGTNYYLIASAGAGNDYVDVFSTDAISPRVIEIYNASQASGTAGQSATIKTANASASIAFSAEL